MFNKEKSYTQIIEDVMNAWLFQNTECSYVSRVKYIPSAFKKEWLVEISQENSDISFCLLVNSPEGGVELLKSAFLRNFQCSKNRRKSDLIYS